MFEFAIDKRFAALPGVFYSQVKAESFAHPQMIALSDEAAKLIGIPPKAAGTQEFLDVFTGKKPAGDYPALSAVYAGHQFGGYVPQLGDGRALTIAETNGYEVQLKGSGRTPYSRFGDGRAVLRSCIREFLCSEAMAGLGIPTTRALCIIGSDEPVRRETVETAAMLTRLSPSHIRFGSFEFFSHTGQHDALRQLSDFTIAQYFPGCDYATWFREVVTRTARLIAQWQLVGFAHGVMNTDNMSILGLTLDYGPFGFMEGFDAGYRCNHSDETGRYAFDQQPRIGLWNLNALAHALSPLVESEALKEALRAYEPAFIQQYENGMRAKLGLFETHAHDADFIRETLHLLHQSHVDYSLFFRGLSKEKKDNNFTGLFSADYQPALHEWLNSYSKRLKLEAVDDRTRQTAMDAVNPKYILRNYLAEMAIRKAGTGDYSEIHLLHAVLKNPFAEQPEQAHYAVLPPEWAADICISCSS